VVVVGGGGNGSCDRERVEDGMKDADGGGSS